MMKNHNVIKSFLGIQNPNTDIDPIINKNIDSIIITTIKDCTNNNGILNLGLFIKDMFKWYFKSINNNIKITKLSFDYYYVDITLHMYGDINLRYNIKYGKYDNNMSLSLDKAIIDESLGKVLLIMDYLFIDNIKFISKTRDWLSSSESAIIQSLHTHGDVPYIHYDDLLNIFKHMAKPSVGNSPYINILKSINEVFEVLRDEGYTHYDKLEVDNVRWENKTIICGTVHVYLNYTEVGYTFKYNTIAEEFEIRKNGYDTDNNHTYNDVLNGMYYLSLKFK